MKKIQEDAIETMLECARTMQQGPDNFWRCPLRAVWGQEWPDKFNQAFPGAMAANIFVPADRFRNYGKEADRQECIEAILALRQA